MSSLPFVPLLFESLLALEGLLSKCLVFGGVGIERAVGKCLADGSPLANVLTCLVGEETILEAAVDVVDGLWGGMQHVGCIEAVVAQLVEQDLVGREIEQRIPSPSQREGGLISIGGTIVSCKTC